MDTALDTERLNWLIRFAHGYITLLLVIATVVGVAVATGVLAVVLLAIL